MANELTNLKPVPGSRKARTRVGRGEGSGKGKTSGRGQKGAKSRSGSKARPQFEGGQMPLHRRLPKRGFRNPFSKEFTVVNVAGLNGLAAGSEVTAETLVAAGVVRKVAKDGVKLLGRGDLSVALNVKVAKVSASAKDKVLAAGGSVEELTAADEG